MATKIVVQQVTALDPNAATVSKYPRYTVRLGTSIGSISAAELASAVNGAGSAAAAAAASAAAAKVSENNAKTSETNANNSKTAAASSATAAATSATTAQNAANTIGTSVAQAAASATAAKASETNAKTSETNAKTSETNSKASETAANASKNAAATSETNANTSKNAAATSATNAATSATNASASATTAGTNATNAGNSATAAAGSAVTAKSEADRAKAAADSIGSSGLATTVATHTTQIAAIQNSNTIAANLLPNPTMVNNGNGWQGNYSLVDNRPTMSTASNFQPSTSTAAVIAGDTIDFTLDVRAMETIARIDIRARFDGDTVNNFALTIGTLLTPAVDTWITVKGTMTVPVGANRVSLQLSKGGNLMAGISNAILTRVSESTTKLNTTVTGFTTDIATLKTDNTTNKSDISTLKTDNTANKSAISSLNTDNVANKAAIALNTTARNNLALNNSPTVGSGMMGYDVKQNYALSTIGRKLNQYVTVEDFANAASAAGDWTTALQAAINYAVSSGIFDVRGSGIYAISNTLNIQGLGLKGGFRLSLNTLKCHPSFPGRTSYWDAKAMILIGDVSVPAVGQATDLDIYIANLFGTHEDPHNDATVPKADGIVAINGGYALSRIFIGVAKRCVAVVRSVNINQNNASNHIEGGAWYSNFVGVHCELGQDTAGNINGAIVEGWKITVKFIAVNYWGGIWFRRSGQLAIVGGDLDYNGNRLAVLRVDELSAENFDFLIRAKRGTMVTNGTEAAELLMGYERQRHKFIVVAFNRDVQILRDEAGTALTPGAPWKVGDTLSFPNSPEFGGATIKLMPDLPADAAIYMKKTVTVCQSEWPNLNFFDILHDFAIAPFAKIQIKCGYLGGIIGGMQWTSNIQFNRGVIDRPLVDLYGLGITNGAGNLALTNTQYSTLAFMTVTTAPNMNPSGGTLEHFTNFDRRINLFNNRYSGATSYVNLSGALRGTWVPIRSFKDLPFSQDNGNKQLANEGSAYTCYLTTDQAGIEGKFTIFLRQMAQGDGSVVSIPSVYGIEKHDTNWDLALARDSDNPGDVVLLLRQDVVNTCVGILNAVRF
jgi:hypothetical protein